MVTGWDFLSAHFKWLRYIALLLAVIPTHKLFFKFKELATNYGLAHLVDQSHNEMLVMNCGKGCRHHLFTAE